MRVGYIISMQAGMAAWNYREIDILSNNGVDIYGFALSWKSGAYMPKPKWHFVYPTALRTLFSQLSAFLYAPSNYLKLMSLSVRMKCFLEFLIAQSFSIDMRKIGVHHIHCHFGDRKLYTGYFCSRILDVPLTVTVHAYEILCNPNPEMFKLAAAHCSKVVTVSEFNKNEINRVFDVPKDHIDVVHIHGDMSDERMRKSVKILIVGEFTEKKGHDILLKALNKLNRNDITLWVVGEGKLNVRKMADNLNVTHQTIFLGRLGKDFLNILFDACDFFVLPSRMAANGDREGVPVAIMEAMSHKKAVISTNHAGIPELVSEILVEENDVEELAKAIAYLADNPAICAEMGERNYKLIKDNYSDAEVMKLKSLYTRSESLD